MDIDHEESVALRVSNPNQLELIIQDNIQPSTDGFLHAYVSNGGTALVHFDNFLISQVKGKVRQFNDYYPYGLSIAGINGVNGHYKNKYTSKELQTGEFPAGSGGLEMFDFEARFYDPQLGRWFAPDPAMQFSNPYLAMGNNPVMYVDPDGEFVWVPIIIGAAIGAYSGHQIGKAKGAEGWQMAGYMFGGAVIGGVSGLAGGAVASGIGQSLTIAGAGTIAGAAGGAVGGAISGGGFAALGGGDVGEGIWKGAVSGLAGGGVGSYIGGGIGAFTGGATAGGLSTALYGGDIEDIGKGALIGGAVAWGGYQVQQGVSYQKYKSDGGDFTYKQFRKISVASQRSFARGKEFGGWILDNGDVELWKPGQKAGITPTSKPGNATGFFHSHPNTGGNWVEAHSPVDVGFNNNYAKTDSYVIGRQNVWLQTPGSSPSILFNNSNLHFNTYPHNFYWLNRLNIE